MVNAQGWRTPCWRRSRKVPVSVRTAGVFCRSHMIIMLSVSGLQPHSEEPDLLPTYILCTISIEIVVFPRASEELRDLDMR